MGENIKLKDLYNEEQSFTDIGTIAVPKTDGSGDTYYVQRPIINYTLQDPPTRELTDADEGAFAWNAGDGTVFEGDLGNFIGSVEASAAGKTTRPIVNIGANKHLSGVTVNANGAAILIYLYEELSGSVLLDVLGETGNTDFTAQVGWGQLLLADTSPLEITGYAKINDPGAVTIGIEQPVGYQKADIFYSLLSEVTQEEQTVSVTENGAQTIVPTAGKSGIRKVALNVNVPSGGGNLQEKSVSITSNGTTEVTPDAGYDGMSKVKAVINVAGGGGNDYYLLKNPLGEMPTYEGGVFQANGKPPVDPKPYVTVIGGLNANSALGYKNTEVFSYKKGTSGEVTSLMFFWYAEDAETIPAALMQQFAGMWPYGDVTLVKGWNITTFSVNGEETTASTTAETLDVVNMELAAYGGIPKDNFNWAEMDAYTLSFFKDAAEPAGVDAKSWVFTNGVASISQADFNKYLAPGVIAAVFINVPLEPVGGTGYSQMQNVMRSESSDGSAQLVFAGEEYSLDETSDPKILTPTVSGFGIISRASADADFVLSYVNAYGNTITPAFTSNGVQVTLYAQLLQL